ncbi:SCP domain-containing protein [Fusarium keratoplasticum]|uniref:SCP domain-containing protein n=1 Tax=Fusarium keratoplasticum TaxID=1328300 RepID=A0ACC0QTT6_9HYPO|nr:SCP domain-containing protein [Fusarium keratoplasticum]KAI8666463.1 SCP domain-containing protein [Fusarium keratoplasticum]
MRLLLPLVSLLGVTLAADEVVTITAPAAIPSNEPEWKTDKTFTSAILNSTNFYRGEHNASSLTWNRTLEEFATDYLDDNDDCKFEHSNGPYGENLAIGYSNVTASVEAWGDERDDYDFDKGEFSKKTGHFTQLVWRDTTGVGCGRKLCGERGWYLVCEYWPRGNVIGQFTDQVYKEEGNSAARVRPGAGLALVIVVYLLVWI